MIKSFNKLYAKFRESEKLFNVESHDNVFILSPRQHHKTSLTHLEEKCDLTATKFQEKGIKHALSWFETQTMLRTNVGNVKSLRRLLHLKGYPIVTWSVGMTIKGCLKHVSHVISKINYVVFSKLCGLSRERANATLIKDAIPTNNLQFYHFYEEYISKQACSANTNTHQHRIPDRGQDNERQTTNQK